MRTASTQARSTRQSVAVSDLTTETSTVTALPDGRLSLTESVLPTRVKQEGRWVPVDTSLRVSGGRLVPVAVPQSLSLSDGGSAMLATLGSSGRSVSVSWPSALPAPSVSGPVATYSDVLPGVDLAVTASVTGFSEVLIVRTPAAARDPGLASLQLVVTGAGVRLAQLADGSLAAVTSGGQELFRAASPVMWDSRTAGPATVQAATADRREARPVLLRSSLQGPGSAARLAGVGMRLGGRGTLALTPNKSMLASPAADFPLYIDPTWQTTAPKASGFDMVQEAAPCNGVPYYDNENSNEDEDALGVGYFPSSWGSCYGTQNAYYVMPIPSALHAANVDVNLATFNASEDYSASCSTDHDVNLIATGSIGTGTDYNTQPPWYTSTLDVTQTGTGVPDTAGNDINCNVTTLGPSSDSEQYGFTITHDMQVAVKQGNGTITLVMTESSQDSSGDSLKRFTNNPSMTIQYDIPPAQPVNVKVGDNTSELGSCPTSGNLPELGASTNGIDVTGQYSQANAENLTAYFQYWDVTAGQTDTTNAGLSTTVAGSTSAKTSNPVVIPQSAVSKMKSGDTVDVKTWSEDPADLTSADVTCSFKVYPTAPGAATVTMTSPADPPMGSTMTFQFGVDTPSECTPSGFEYAVDETPVSGSETAAVEQDGVWTASISTSAIGSGEHEVKAFATCSNDPNDTNTGTSGEFAVGTDVPLTCASWSAAMAGQCTNSAGQTPAEPYDNTMFGGGDSACPSNSGDGGGLGFDMGELEAQGWTPGAHLTVDGASFTLPDYNDSGSGSCPADNVLAANQTIGMPGQGSALVFLATSTSSHAELTDGTGATASGGSVFGSDDTAPPVPAGTQVSGEGCTLLTAFSSNDTGCQPAEGMVNYANGYSAPFYMTAPDWYHGSADIAAVTTAQRQSVNGNTQPLPVKIFAFSVPLNPTWPIASVTLPDVGDSVESSGLNYTLSGLHIFGMSVRNNTTATPQADGSAATVSSSCGCGWTGAYEAPIETGWPVSGAFGDQTIRVAVSLNVSAPAGTQIRIHVADPGFLTGDGDAEISIGSATVATQSSAGSPAAAQAPQELHFGGGSAPPTSVTLCGGCDLYSNPVTLQNAVTAGQDLLVSLFVANGSTSSQPAALPYLPGSMSPSGGEEWTTASASGDHTADTAATSFSSPSAQDSLLTGVDVITTKAAGASYEASDIAGDSGSTYAGYAPGEPTVVVAGNNVTDNGLSGVTVAPDEGSPSERIAGDLANPSITTQTVNAQQEPTAYGYGVVDAGIENNQLQADYSGAGGVSLLARIDRDVLAEPDVGTVVVNEGLEDLLQDGVPGNDIGDNIGDDVINAYSQLVTVLSGFGITIVFDTLTPCGGYPGAGSPADACGNSVDSTSYGVITVDDARQQVVNEWLDNNGTSNLYPQNMTVADTDCAVSSVGPTDCIDSPETLGSSTSGASYNEGDDVNLSPAGYAQAATAIVPSDLYPAAFEIKPPTGSS